MSETGPSALMPPRAFFDGRAQLVPFVRHADARGVLTPLDFGTLPFVVRRAFIVTQVPTGATRGGHAHRTAQQLLVCLRGRIDILMRAQQQEVLLTLGPETPGLLVDAGVWCRQTYVDPDSTLLVFASEAYDPGSYIDHWT